MDTLGPRIMVNVGTQAVTNTGLNPRDLAPLTNDAFLATFMGKPALPATNGTSRQNNNYHRQPYTTQMERLTLRSKPRSSATNGESIEPDSAILSIIRGNGLENNHQQTSQRQPQGNRNYRRPFNQKKYFSGWNDIPCSPNYRPTNESNRQRRTRSGGAQQQITVVDQMAAQPHIPYAILPKRFEPKQLSTNAIQQQSRSSNNNANYRHRPATAAPRRQQRQQAYYDDQWEDVEDDDGWNESANRRRGNRRPNQSFGQTNAYRGQRQNFNDYYNSYSYGQINRHGQVPVHSNRRMIYQNDGYIPFNIVPSYDLNQWQGPYARSRQSLHSQQQRNGFRQGGYYDDGFIRDDHRLNNSSKQSRYTNKPTTPTRHRKQTKPVKSKGPSKRRNSRPRKQRNQNSKSEGSATTNTSDVKSTTETTEENKPKEESTITVTSTETEEKPLPPRDNENKQIEVEKPTE